MRILRFLLIFIALSFIVVMTNAKSFGIYRKSEQYLLEVHVVDESKQTAQKVFDEAKKFDFDPKTKMYKLCIGKRSPTTYLTTCVVGEKVIITNFVDAEKRPQSDTCFYVNKDKNYCHLGDEDGEIFQESELTF